MVGITSYGAYVPLFRLDKKVIGGRGEKAIANFDEDNVTMAAAAVNDCLNGIDRKTVDGLYLATTTSPYKEHLGATTTAMATDLKQNAYTAEFANSLRASTAAFKAAIDGVKAGSVKNMVVAAADCRPATPGSALERNFGDGAAAILIGDENVAVTLEGSYSVYNEIYDVWRNENDTFVRFWEDRFAIEQGYLPSMYEAVSGLMKKFDYKPADFAKVVFYSPDARRGAQVAKSLGFEAAQVQDPLINVMGNTGTASALMLLVAALEEAKAGDLILLANYGNGADAFALKVTEQIEEVKNGNRLGMKGHLASKKITTDYLKYLRWRRIVPIDRIAGPNVSYSAVAAKRDYVKDISIHGSRCTTCGYVQYPPQRVCTKCHAKDQMEPYSFLGKKGKIVTYNMDYITPSIEGPVVTTEVDFEGGGRMQTYMTEADLDKITIDLAVEMTFRRYPLWETITLREGVYTYLWKSTPLRTDIMK
ncbi:MAG: 3-oxoacyl-[acyl-carrier-protein] synthase III C-terminal domain-containing protein [Chloroflexota bacterium]|nr:3-oxoacyl-[acyl-carrier-protein] synthase III C-terminal domain-containing protein [Chloroflexota bacterium]